MKKKYFLLVSILIIGVGLQAQTVSKLIGLTKARYDGTAFAQLGDSAWYKYSPLNDTSHAGLLAFDSSYLYAYLPGFTSNNSTIRYYQTMDGNNNIATIISQSYDTPSVSWINFLNKAYTYDASNNNTVYLLKTWDNVGMAWVNSRNTLNTFSGMNNTIKILQLWNITSSAWVNSTKDSFSYDVSNNLLYHLAQTWDTTNMVWVNASQFIYTYNTNLVATALRQTWDPIGMTWFNTANALYHHAGTLLTNTIVQRWDTIALAWINVSADSLTYYGSTSNKDHELQLRWDTTNHIWTNRTLDIYTFDVNNNMLSDTTFNWSIANSVFNNSKIKIYSYNSYNQPSVYTTTSWDNTNLVWYYRFTGNANGRDVQWRYYYAIDTITAVSQLNKTNASLSVFPSPANDLLNIKINWNANTSFTIQIVDMNGGVVRKWDEAANTIYSKQIVVSDLPEGNYIIRVVGSSAQLVQKFLIVR